MRKSLYIFSVIYLFIFLLILPVFITSEAANDKTFLWKVQSESSTAYLLGSIHFMQQAAYPLDERIEKAFESSDVLAVEANINDISKLDMKKLITTAFYQENDSQFIIEMAAPGLKKEDFKINLEDHVLTISREQKEDKEEQTDHYTRREFVYNSFSRSFRLPKIILEDKIKADYKDGLLKVNLPKDAKANLTREISIN